MPANLPTLYLVTDRQALYVNNDANDRIAALLDLLTEAAKAGIDLIQIREKDLSGRQLFSLVESVVNAVRPLGARVFVNDRVDVALACGADGVHLAGNSIPVEVVRRLVGPKMLLGVSTHSSQEVDTAERGGADFVVLGPVFETPSKIKYGAPLGLTALAEVADRTKLPVIAIGGITEENYHSVLKHGASGIAAIKMFAESDSLVELVSRLKTIDDATRATTPFIQK